jgi:hypothetical protein
MSDKTKAILEKAKGKKAKVKQLDKALAGTKVLKLPKDVKADLAEAFPKAKWQTVRIHVGGNAKELCKELKVKAFTCGPDIAFAKAGDAKNAELLAHELSHAVQQGQGKIPKVQPGRVLVTK